MSGLVCFQRVMRGAVRGILVGALAWFAAGAPGQVVSSLGWIAETVLSPDDQTRYTQGVRLRRLEAEWAVADLARRKQATGEIQRAVRGYFAGRARDVSQGLDRAVATLQGVDSRDPARLLADSLDVVPVPALADPTLTASLRLSLGYGAKAKPEPLLLRVAAEGRVTTAGISPLPSDSTRPLRPDVSQRSNELTQVLHTPAASWARDGRLMPVGRALINQQFLPALGLRQEVPLDLGQLVARSGIPAGEPTDFVLLVQIGTREGRLLRSWRILFSVMPDRDARLARLVELQDRLTRTNPGSLEAQTVRHERFVLEKLAAGPPRETDLAAAGTLAALLTVLEPVREVRDAGCLLRSLVLAAPDRSLTVDCGGFGLASGRVRIGGAAERLGDPAAPVIIAIHGAGGSENMFHDAYGLGLLARECRSRGWLLLAPRIHSPADDVWSLLEPILGTAPHGPVILLGHSMGSLTAVEMARQRPQSVAGVVAISVGGRDDVSMLRGMPVLVAAGREDFGRGSSRVLYENLKRAGAQVRWLETPSEHLMVVADALPEVVEWMASLISSKFPKRK